MIHSFNTRSAIRAATVLRCPTSPARFAMRNPSTATGMTMAMNASAASTSASVKAARARLEPVLKTGGADDPPAPVGDPTTGTAAGNVVKRPCPLARTVAPVPSGESPDGTGESPVLPANLFPNTRLTADHGGVACLNLISQWVRAFRYPNRVVRALPKHNLLGTGFSDKAIRL